MSPKRVCFEQLELLCQFVSNHREVCLGFNKSIQARSNSKRAWKNIAEQLNAQVDGTRKDWKGWSKYWVDYKAKLKRRCAAMRQSVETGGQLIDSQFTDQEKKFLMVMGLDFGNGLEMPTFEPFSEAEISSLSGVKEGIYIIEPPEEPAKCGSTTPDAGASSVGSSRRPSFIGPIRRRKLKNRHSEMSSSEMRRALVRINESRAASTESIAESFRLIVDLLKTLVEKR